MFKITTNKLNSPIINPLSSYTFKTFNPLNTKDYIFLYPNDNNEYNNNYEFLFNINNLNYYKLNLTQSYSNIKVFEINNIKFNITENINQMKLFEFYYNPIENYIIFVV